MVASSYKKTIINGVKITDLGVR
uniref:Uncharacterized protein n=1 Tax=Rhizophora mucronata TaxID=61149 RepID=A0A2P2QPD5_RHIMU